MSQAQYTRGGSRLRSRRVLLTLTSIFLSGGLVRSVCLPGRCWPTFLSSRAPGRSRVIPASQAICRPMG